MHPWVTSGTILKHFCLGKTISPGFHATFDLFVLRNFSSAPVFVVGHPSLHQGMAPGFPSSMGGALPSAYQFARDPQSGQLVMIPSEHLTHFGRYPKRIVPSDVQVIVHVAF